MIRCHVDTHLRWVEIEDEKGARRQYRRRRRLETWSGAIHVEKEVNDGPFALTSAAAAASAFPETVILKTISLKMRLFEEAIDPVVPVGVFVFYEFE
jgi:hypothetical protein